VINGVDSEPTKDINELASYVLLLTRDMILVMRAKAAYARKNQER
jgi:hypothetical protein